MNREEFVAKLSEFGLDRHEFCILSGGSLLMQGLREKTSDFDLSMSKKMAREIGLYDKPRDEYGFYLPFPDVQAKDDFSEFDKVLVDGFWCESLESVLEFKKSKMREKDLPDIEKITLKLLGDALRPIEYGWCDAKGKVHDEYGAEFAEKYCLQSPEELRSSKLGVCWDQVEFERKVLEDLGVSSRTFFIVYYDDDACPTHTFITFELNGKTIWYEHSWEPMRGVHEYATISDLVADVRARFIDGMLKGKCDEDKLVIYEYEKPKPHLSCAEFYKHCEAGKKFTL